MIFFDNDRLVEQIKSLKELPQIKEVKALRKRLERELERLTSSQVIEKIPSQVIGISPNVKRSSKLSRYWRYVKLVRDNFPHLKIKHIRSELKKRQHGEESNIPDAVWQNPSG